MTGVDKAIGELGPELKTLAVTLRKIIRESIPQAEETLKWGNPCYVVGKKKIVFICAYRDHLNLGFFEGARLKSPLLEGTGKGMRHVKVFPGADITANEREIARLLKKAADGRGPGRLEARYNR